MTLTHGRAEDIFVGFIMLALIIGVVLGWVLPVDNEPPIIRQISDTFFSSSYMMNQTACCISTGVGMTFIVTSDGFLVPYSNTSFAFSTFKTNLFTFTGYAVFSIGSPNSSATVTVSAEIICSTISFPPKGTPMLANGNDDICQPLTSNSITGPAPGFSNLLTRNIPPHLQQIMFSQWRELGDSNGNTKCIPPGNPSGPIPECFVPGEKIFVYLAAGCGTYLVNGFFVHNSCVDFNGNVTLTQATLIAYA